MTGATFTTLSESSTALYNNLLLGAGLIFAALLLGSKFFTSAAAGVKSALVAILSFLVMVGLFIAAVAVYSVDHNRAADSLVANLEEHYDVTLEAKGRDLLRGAQDGPLAILVTPIGSDVTSAAILTIDGDTATLSSSTGTTNHEWSSPTD